MVGGKKKKKLNRSLLHVKGKVYRDGEGETYCSTSSILRSDQNTDRC